jgi:hypothetical protein
MTPSFEIRQVFPLSLLILQHKLSQKQLLKEEVRKSQAEVVTPRNRPKEFCGVQPNYSGSREE